ncbi:MAG: sensor domain-containing diguanylate cyclase, partial [Lachnospiraceae bacterium]
AATAFFFHPDDREKAVRELYDLVENKTTSYEARLRRFDQSYVWCRVDLSLTLNEHGKPYRLVGFLTDIDDIKTQAILSELQAQKDSMTELYNKAAMVSRSNQCLQENTTGKHALMILDIDNFKGINDSLGHAFGDLVLIDIAAKLKTAFRDDDIVGRIGGDEFAVLMKNVSNTSNVLKKGTELSEVFRQNYAGENGTYKISCSIGI